MKRSLMTIGVLCALAASARAQEETTKPPPSSQPALPPAPLPENAPPTPSGEKRSTERREPTISAEPGTGLTYKSATDTVTLYGLLDITISAINHANAKGDWFVGYQTSWFSGDRWGITGKHLFGTPDKLGIAFRLESEYTLNTGAMDTPNVLFNRDAWIGFESDTIGQIHFGRQNTLPRDFSQNYGDPYGTPNVRLDEGGWTNTNNFKQLIFYAGSVTSTRYDNGIVWKKAFGANIIAGLGYQFGEIAGDFKKNTTAAAALAFNGGFFNISGFFNHANVNLRNANSFSVGGNVQLIPLIRLNAGYFHYWADQGVNNALPQRTDNAYTVSTKITPGGPFDFEVGWQLLKATDAAYNSAGFTPNPFADVSTATTFGSGDKKTFYGSIFYRFDRRTELYLAGDYMWLNGGYKVAVTNGSTDQVELAIGTRFRF
jgi:predicted porin